MSVNLRQSAVNLERLIRANQILSEVISQKHIYSRNGTDRVTLMVTLSHLIKLANQGRAGKK